jgi:hypothetical protein
MIFYSHTEEVRLQIEECEQDLVGHMLRSPARQQFMENLVKLFELERIQILESGNLDRARGVQDAITKLKAIAKKATK